MIGAQIQLLVLVEDGRQPIVFHHLADDSTVVEILDNIVHVLRKSVEVSAEVLFQKGVVFLKHLAEGPVGLIGKRRLLGVLFQFLDQGVDFRLASFRLLFPNLCFCPFAPFEQHTL